jgi:hypothetical protein
MSANIEAFGNMMQNAIYHFWKSRFEAAQKQIERGTADQGNRSSVTAGKNLDGFVAMIRQLIIDNGIKDTEVLTDGRTDLTIPGFYRPTKNWDLLVVSHGKLMAAIEFKSQVGPSFGNNFNNRVEEAIGNAIDLNTAFREGVFGDATKPFLGYFFILEECPKSMSPVGFHSPFFRALPEFNKASYAMRYEILCRKLVQEQLYDAATLVLTENTGSWRDLSDLTSAKRFAATLAGKISGMALE